MLNTTAARSGRLRAALAGASSRTSDHHSGGAVAISQEGGVCFAPKSGRVGRLSAPPRRAITELMHCSKRSP